MKIIDGFVVRKIGERAVAVAVSGKAQNFHGMISLNDTAECMWNALTAGATQEEVVETLCKEYNVEKEIAARDAEAFIGKLRGAGLIEE